MDAEGHHEGIACPRCGALDTITYVYNEGFDELECPTCGYRSDAEELDLLTRFGGDLLEGRDGLVRGRLPEDDPATSDLPPIPRRSLEA